MVDSKFEWDDSILKEQEAERVEREKQIESMRKLKTTISAKHKKLMKVLEGNSTALIKKVVAQALKGNSQMLKFCIERLLPPREQIENPQFVLPEKITVDNISDVAGQVVRLVALGHLSSKRGREVAEILQVYAQTVEVSATEDRLRKLENFIDRRTDLDDPEVPFGQDDFVPVGKGHSIQ